jgi:hypothetical protein
MPDQSPSFLYFSPDQVTISQAGPEHSQTVTVLASIADTNISPDGFTLSLDYDDTLLTFTNVENIAPYTQALGGIDFSRSPLRFTYVKDLLNQNNTSVLGVKTIAQMGQGGTTMCTQDVTTCPDGTQVGRTPPSCSFICPGDPGYIPRSPSPFDDTRSPYPTPTPSSYPSPSATAYPSPSSTPSYQLVRLTFHAKYIPSGTPLTTHISFGETSVVSAKVDGSIVDYGNILPVTFVDSPAPTSDPTTSITCQPIVYKVPGPDYLVSASDRVATDSNIIKAQVGDSYAYSVQVTNISEQTLSTSGIPLKFTAASTNPYQDFQRIYSHLNNCELGNNQISCETDHLNLPAGQSIILPAGEPSSPFFVTSISDTTQENATSTFEFSFGRGLSCGMIHVETLAFKPGDLNRDGSVNLFDYQELITGFGNPYTIFDYQKIITNYGQ